MMEIIKGKIWKFGDDINTDLIAPGRYMSSSVDEMKRHVFEVINPDFNSKVKPGDLIVGGDNFGCGSSREEAPAVLKACGIAGIIAESFARIFYRNAIAIGLPVITCKGVSSAFAEGDIIEIDMNRATVTGIPYGIELKCEVLSGDIRKVLETGGILPLLKEIASSQEN